MCEIQSLGLIASRLLVALLAYGEDEINAQPKTQMMEMVGAKRKQSYSDACAELERLGFIRLERRRGGRSGITLLSFLSSAGGGRRGSETPLTTSKYISIIEGSLTGSTGSTNGVYNAQTVYQDNAQTVYQQEVQRANGVPTTRERYTAETVHRVDVAPPSLLDRCIALDAMEADGEKTSVNSNFAKRRRAQLPLVQEVWDHFFPDTKTLLAAHAKELLVLSHDSLEALHEELEYAADQARKLTEKKGKPIEYPYNYAVKTLKSRKNEQGRSVPSPLSSAEPVRADAPVPDPRVWDGELMEPGVAWMQKREAALQAAQRIWKEA